MTHSTAELTALLKKYFGFDSFRPLQEEIIRDSLAGKDVLALLPTGGGKSLCFQLPALVRPGLTVVVSPLIALMKDQVDSMVESGVPATFINSSLEPGEAKERLAALDRGEYKLLYVAPERLMLSGFLSELSRRQVSLFAIDEAHCISEWGHDFRPEYRQLAELRERFPATPFLALTATATERVREDIARQLKLKGSRYVASFNRPNLFYKVVGKSGAYKQLLAYIEDRGDESGIVYCQSRRAAEDVASRLAGDGISARPYHAGMAADDRSRNQELFIKDDVRVICATIAFGMGINKPNVRFVVHYDLPKSLEGYYQETGRAGRDGLPSECLLLYSPGDAAKHIQFIAEKTDPEEARQARAQLDLMVHYAEDATCRRMHLLNYFGETAEGSCAACDNCVSPRETYDGTTAAHKFLSCVFRIREKSGFSTGIAHVIEVLTGAETEKVRKWGHESLTTYGIGKDVPRAEWSATGRELVRLGFLKQGGFGALELTPVGRAVLSERRSVELTKPMTKKPARDKAAKAVKAPRAGQVVCDETLFDRLRQLRKRLADEKGVPAYVVFPDTALREMARDLPSDEKSLLRVNGVGEKKLREYGRVFLEEITSFRREDRLAGRPVS